ncbi:MAG: hypothetical protein BWY82_02416 [Verrucomicrobia bacterium ADurb.Bin474]|nr:MAG: hypothetical protein BWY82_02416 [Verrucomicrobia bacterium ADurb.Bin474]
MEKKSGLEWKESFHFLMEFFPCSNAVNRRWNSPDRRFRHLKPENFALRMDVRIAHGKIQTNLTDQASRMLIEELNPLPVPSISRTSGPPWVDPDSRPDPCVGRCNLQHSIPIVFAGGIGHASPDPGLDHVLEN